MCECLTKQTEKAQVVLGFNSQILENIHFHSVTAFIFSGKVSELKSFKVHLVQLFNRHTFSHPDISDESLPSVMFWSRPDSRTLDFFSWWTVKRHREVFKHFRPGAVTAAPRREGLMHLHSVRAAVSAQVFEAVMGDGAGFSGRWKVTGSGVRRKGPPISVCTRSVHTGWWPASERSPSRPEPSPSPDRTERRGAPSVSPTSATAGGEKKAKVKK